MIGRIVDRCLIRQLLFASVVALVVFSAPVVLISLSMQLPSEVMLSKLVWPALATITPMIVYHTLPLLVPVAIVWCYANFSSDGTLVTMHMAGLSNLSVRAPAITVAIAAMAIAYAMSCWVAPSTAGNLQDVMNSLRHDMNPALLRIGQFNSIDGGRQVVFFRSRLDDNTVADVFIRERAGTAEERIYQAKQAVFARDVEEAKGGIILLDGTVQSFNGDKTRLSVTAFDRLVLPLTEFVPGRSTHTYTLVEELGPLAFLLGRVEAFRTPAQGRNWTREAVKRFVIPALALIHTLLGLALLAAWGTMSGRETDPVALVCIMLASLHFAVVSMAEQTGVALPWAGAAVAVAVAELAAAIAVMTLGSRRATPAPRSLSARMSVVHAEDAEDAFRPVALGAVDGTAQQVVKKMA